MLLFVAIGYSIHVALWKSDYYSHIPVIILIVWPEIKLVVDGQNYGG